MSALEPKMPAARMATPAIERPVQPVRPPRRKSKRYYRPQVLLALVILVVLGAMVGLSFALTHHGKRTITTIGSPSGSTATTQPELGKDSIRLIATGDFIAHDSVNSAALKSDGTYDYLPMMKDFLPIFKTADIKFCNDPILNGGKQFGITGYPVFNSPTEFVTDMGKLGCNLVNTASNHSFDKTQDVISASTYAWDNVPNMLAVAGQNRTQEEHDKVHIFTNNGIKMAFLAYTTYTNKPTQNSFGVNMFSTEFASTQIAAAKAAGAQFIIVSMRWGTEYSNDVNAAQKQQAQWLADQGVNLVLGHGPHVLQTTAELTGSGGNKTLVWYSLGNFINTQIPVETVFNGIAVMDINIKTKQIASVRYLPIYMHYEWTAAQAAAQTLDARHNLHLYLLEDAKQSMLDAQQLKTTIDAQKQRLQSTLNLDGLTIPLIEAKDY